MPEIWQKDMAMLCPYGCGVFHPRGKTPTNLCISETRQMPLSLRIDLQRLIEQEVSTSARAWVFTENPYNYVFSTANSQAQRAGSKPAHHIVSIIDPFSTPSRHKWTALRIALINNVETTIHRVSDALCCCIATICRDVALQRLRCTP